METVQTDTRPARQRILDAAAELFYHQGYRATGINEVIQKADVAKATFYSHFSSKEDLCLAYLKEKSISEFEEAKAFTMSHAGPLERFLSVMQGIEPWMVNANYRGCGFLNIITEVPDANSLLRQESIHHYEMLRDFIQELTEELIQSDKSSYGHLNPQRVAQEYMVILLGAIGMAEVYRETWPIHQGLTLVQNLLNS